MIKQNGKVIIEKGDSLASVAHHLGCDLQGLIVANQGRLPLKVGEHVNFPPTDDIDDDDESILGGFEGNGGAAPIVFQEEEVKDLIAQVEGFAGRVQALEENETELRKLTADGIEALQHIGKELREEITKLNARLDGIEVKPPETSDTERATQHEG